VSAQFSVTFNTNVSGAVITVGSRPPVTTDGSGNAVVTGLTVGQHSYTVTATGYNSFTGSVNVQSSGQIVNVPQLTQITYTADIKVVSGEPEEPLSGAVVLIGGRNETTGADGMAKITGIPAGTHVVTVIKAGYAMSGNVSIVFDGNKSQTVTMSVVTSP
jgi:hypothetical protein